MGRVPRPFYNVIGELSTLSHIRQDRHPSALLRSSKHSQHIHAALPSQPPHDIALGNFIRKAGHQRRGHQREPEAMTDTLSQAQAAALLDILTHHELYAEAREFRFPGILEQHGPPFVEVAGRPSATPALQVLTSRFACTLPGLGDVPESFWTVQVRGLLEALAEANLSESYDKGVIGSRRTLATAICAILEYPVRFAYAGAAKEEKTRENYDMTNADEIYEGYSNCLNEIVYGDMIEDLFQTARKTDNPAEFRPSVQAAHEYLLIK